MVLREFRAVSRCFSVDQSSTFAIARSNGNVLFSSRIGPGSVFTWICAPGEWPIFPAGETPVVTVDGSMVDWRLTLMDFDSRRLQIIGGQDGEPYALEVQLPPPEASEDIEVDEFNDTFCPGDFDEDDDE